MRAVPIALGVTLILARFALGETVAVEVEFKSGEPFTIAEELEVIDDEEGGLRLIEDYAVGRASIDALPVIPPPPPVKTVVETKVELRGIGFSESRLFQAVGIEVEWGNVGNSESLAASIQSFTDRSRNDGVKYRAYVRVGDDVREGKDIGADELPDEITVTIDEDGRVEALFGAAASVIVEDRLTADKILSCSVILAGNVRNGASPTTKSVSLELTLDE